MNDSDSAPVDGIAERAGDHITVKLKQPVAKTFDLDGSIVFPTEQISTSSRRRAKASACSN